MATRGWGPERRRSSAGRRFSHSTSAQQITVATTSTRPTPAAAIGRPRGRREGGCAGICCRKDSSIEGAPWGTEREGREGKGRDMDSPSRV
eukprot:scaffold99292_cov32-Tisochrysis_lutea.AAC.5